ncbi:MAG: MFS transporter [Rhodoferax sp.]|nr:MFS transporter [Rhodoferax sp.]
MHPSISLSRRRELWLLFTLAGIQFTNIVDFMIMMPLGPQFTALFGIRDAEFGLLVSAYTLAAGGSGLLAATYLDRFDRRHLLLVLYTLFGLATLACGLAGSYGSLMAARILAGVFGGVLSALVQTIVADLVPFDRRGRAMSIVMTSFSVATVAGVPTGLFLASHFSWHVPFFAIAALVGLLGVLAAITVPTLSAHLQTGRSTSVLRSIAQALADSNHRRAFAFSALLMAAGFTVIPFITIYLQTNAGWRADQVSYLYLFGGVASLLVARSVGILTDRYGKVRLFRITALAVTVPIMLTTLTEGWPMAVVLCVSTSFFACMSARMIPGMAIIASAADPALRGTFMAINASVQSAAMGVAAFIGGSLIGRDAAQSVQGYWKAGLLGVLASLATVWLAGRIALNRGATAPVPPTQPQKA